VDRGLGTVWKVRPSNIVTLDNCPAHNVGDALALVTNPRNYTSTYTLDILGWQTRLDTPDNATQNWGRDPSEQVNQT
jgi:hypothetical protein